MFQHSQKLMRTLVELEVHLDAGDIFLGKVGLSQGQRVSDLLNDERMFLPVELPGGKITIVRKAVISKVVPLDQIQNEVERDDPYEILGVGRDISDDELTLSYRKLCAENHPDKVQASGLSDHFIEMANTRIVRITDAYRRICENRKQTAAHSG